MRYQSTATHHPFDAASQSEAVLIAATRLEQERGGKVKLDSVEHHEGNYSACVATVTTMEKVWQGGVQVEQPRTEQRRFMVKPA